MQTLSGSIARRARVIPLDGAALLFDPATGTNVRIDGPSTRRLVRAAPRVVMFGITNLCNLRCGFCSRDLTARSSWDEASAFAMLSGLAERGVLEVAFGGGEPLLFRGFDALVERLARETPLAIHVTTNATLLTEERLARLAPFLGEIRVSIYDDNPWPLRIAELARSGRSFGANVLVTPDRIPDLGPLLGRLRDLGCPDVALLRYVGPDRAMQLDAHDEARLLAAARGCGMRVRLSVCFGDHLGELPRLFDGDRGDCGAGGEFVVLTPDRRMKACSFATETIAVDDADDVLRAYRDERARLAEAVALPGCARPRAALGNPSDGIRIWQGFSGNNSGDCVLVGRFERAADAEAFVEGFADGFVPGAEMGDAWKARFREMGVEVDGTEYVPDVLVAVGRSVLAHTAMAPEDDFPSLRKAAWKAGARLYLNAIHEHDPILLAAGLGFADAESLEAAEVALGIDDVGSFARRGLSLLGTVDVDAHGGPGGLDEVVATLRRVASAHGAEVAAELVVSPEEGRPTLASLLQQSSVEEARRETLFMNFRDLEHAEEFAGSSDGRMAAAGRALVATARRVASHDAIRASARGATATVIPSRTVVFETFFYFEGRAQEVDADAVHRELTAELGPYADVALASRWKAAAGTVTTERPLVVLPFLARFAAARGLTLSVDARSRRPLADAIARVDVDLSALRKSRRSRKR